MSGLPSKPTIGGQPISNLPKKPSLDDSVIVEIDADEIEEFKPRRIDGMENASPVLEDFSDSAEEREVEAGDTLHVDELLEYIISRKAADLHLTAGSKPMFRIHGDIEAIPGYNKLSSSEVTRLIYEILGDAHRAEFEANKEINLSYSIPNKGRFRVNVFLQRGTAAAAIRYIPNAIVSLDDLNMPDVMEEFAKYPRGLVLITGPTGSGKSTTLAAIIDDINTNRASHIITIEDPIEFVHDNKKSIINQREVGVDTNSFAVALKNSLRQDPDVILLGEMRDLETISAALTAAETGHLVFATLHTQSASETMARIIDVFPAGSKDQVRSQLAASLQAIACQSLVKKLDGSGMVAAVEILKANGAIRALIRKGQDEQIRTMMETNKGIGMQTLDSHLLQLVKENVVPIDEALSKAQNADNFIITLGGEEAVSKIRRSQENLGGASY